MRQRFLVHEAPVAGSPATHALVIGVGDYPHLKGGSAKQTDDHGGMGQLTSPPISARLFATWLIRSFKHPSKPLATVSLLLSEAVTRQFVDPVQRRKATTVEVASSANTQVAIREWFNRGNTHPDNLLILYFCGHGIAAGTDTALLLADYGADPLDSLEGAIDFRRFRLGMGRCWASEQCFFVDACRTQSDTLIDAGAAGRYVVKPGVRDPEWPPRKAPVFYATMNGFKAYAMPNEPSVYTDALLKALQDLAADDEMGDWRVNTNRIQSAVEHIVARRALEISTLVPPTSDDASNIFINYLEEPPQALVYVKTDPPEELANASLAYQRSGETPVSAPPGGRKGTEWILSLPAGNYHFMAAFPRNRQYRVENGIKPVFRTVKLNVLP